MKFFIAIFLLLSSLITGKAQTSFLPQPLGEEVNSTYADINPVISPDGKMLYFVRVNHPENTYGEFDSQDIWVSYFENGKWQPAKRLPEFVNKARYNAVLSISSDGNTVLINGLYTRKGKWKKRGLSVYSQIFPGEFSNIHPVKVRAYSRINKGIASNCFMNGDGNVLLFSFTRRFNGKKNNLYISQRKTNGKWKRPKKIKKPVSTRYSEEAPFLSADNKTLYFTRKSKTGYDIYFCTRLDDSYFKWSEPKLLSDTINSAAYDSYFRTNLKGSWGYFCSSRNNQENIDIYRVKLFEENPFVSVRSNVIDKRTGKVLTGKETCSVLINGERLDSIKVDPANGSYSFKLPLGKKYKLAAGLENYTSLEDTMDVTKNREYIEVSRNLYVESYPYVSVSGKLLRKGTNKIIHATTHPHVTIDGAKIDSVIIHPDGTYLVKLPFGQSYSLAVLAQNYIPVASNLDLTNVNEFQEITKDLYADSLIETISRVEGRVINNKTQQPLSHSVAFQVEVNGKEHPAVIIKDSSYYKMNLKPGDTYIVNATAQGYFPVYEKIVIPQNLKDTLVHHLDLVLTPVEVGQSVKLNNIFFNTAKSTLKPSSFEELDKVVKFLNANPTLVIQIEGHTDNVGNPAVNLKLSQARALSVENYLESKGIHKDRIVSQGYGMTKPVASNNTKEGKAKNRRVEFRILEE